MTKFKKGDKVKVLELETVIEKVEYIELFEDYSYWFKDENGKLWQGWEFDIELID